MAEAAGRRRRRRLRREHAVGARAVFFQIVDRVVAGIDHHGMRRSVMVFIFDLSQVGDVAHFAGAERLAHRNSPVDVAGKMNDEGRNVIRGLRGAKDKSFRGPRFGKFRRGRYRTWADWYGLAWFCGRRRGGGGTAAVDMSSASGSLLFSRSGMAVPEQTPKPRSSTGSAAIAITTRGSANCERYGDGCSGISDPLGAAPGAGSDARGIAGHARNGRVLRLERIDVLGFVSHAGFDRGKFKLERVR